MSTQKTKIGLLFGSFNPIHIGHLFMGEMAIESGVVDEVWFVVSPGSPYKFNSGSLAHEDHRLMMVKESIAYNSKFSVDTTEFSLQRPSFTYITLQKLKETHPNNKFFFICGTDVFVDIPTWEGGKEVIELSDFIVYPRNTSTNYIPKEMEGKTTFLNGVPNLEISATFLREQIKNDRTVKHLLPESVAAYIKQNNLYK